MTYLNGILGWGALAFSIPLIIHLLNRSRYREVQWGAMHLLESVIRVNHRKFHLEQLLLFIEHDHRRVPDVVGGLGGIGVAPVDASQGSEGLGVFPFDRYWPNEIPCAVANQGSSMPSQGR